MSSASKSAANVKTRPKAVCVSELLRLGEVQRFPTTVHHQTDS
jgi:hypothetical protein